MPAPILTRWEQASLHLRAIGKHFRCIAWDLRGIARAIFKP